MSPHLKSLVEEWNNEIPIFEIRQDAMWNSFRKLSATSKLIWDQCIKEGIDQDTIGMRKTKQSIAYEKEHTRPATKRKSKDVRPSGDEGNKQGEH